jgi:hypothetical protein
LPASPVDFSFLYGIGSDGLCPFELALSEKCQGDTLRLMVGAAESREFFGHLLIPLRQAFNLRAMPESMWLQIEVTGVTDADNREVVKALAENIGHGGGCGGTCDCGCS